MTVSVIFHHPVGGYEWFRYVGYAASLQPFVTVKRIFFPPCPVLNASSLSQDEKPVPTGTNSYESKSADARDLHIEGSGLVRQGGDTSYAVRKSHSEVN